MLYLCCLFPAEKDLTRGDLNYYARNSEWIESKTKEEAVREYIKRHPGLTRWCVSNDIKILAESARLLNNIVDGDNGYSTAMKLMIASLEDNKED